ncbi:MAG: hypothetical protein ACOY4Q_12050 [Bacillota bacterium]
MAVDTPQVQRGIAKWTLIVSVLIGGLAYILGARTFAYGLAFGVVVSIVNYRVVGLIIHIALRAASPDLAKVLSFAGYHVRFWILVVILYLVIPRAPFYFGVGTFVGILVPKMIMGVFVVMHTEDEWWSKKPSEAVDETPAGIACKPKDKDEGLRYPGLDYDDRFKGDDSFKRKENPFQDIDEKFEDPDGWL